MTAVEKSAARFARLRRYAAGGRAIPLLALVVAVATGASFVRAAQAGSVPEIRPGIPAGYLAHESVPDSLALIPAEPPAGSAALAMDKEMSRADLALRGTPRWNLATEDANL